MPAHIYPYPTQCHTNPCGESPGAGGARPDRPPRLRAHFGAEGWRRLQSCDTLTDFVAMSRAPPRDPAPIRVRGGFRGACGSPPCAVGRIVEGEGVYYVRRGVFRPGRYGRRGGAFSGVFRGVWRRCGARFWKRAKNGPRNARVGLDMKPCVRTARRALRGVFWRFALILASEACAFRDFGRFSGAIRKLQLRDLRLCGSARGLARPARRRSGEVRGAAGRPSDGSGRRGGLGQAGYRGTANALYSAVCKISPVLYGVSAKGPL